MTLKHVGCDFSQGEIPSDEIMKMLNVDRVDCILSYLEVNTLEHGQFTKILSSRFYLPADWELQLEVVVRLLVW